ncbi:WD40 repeat-like protein, partial [Patellaria atrata CBS 101060]
MDSGPDAGALVPAPTAEDEISAAESDHGHGRPAWQDSDDERVTVSLASVPRLRKLREKESDDIVSGKEYIKRLRRQYVRLNPEPDWVKEARALNLKKRTRNEEDDTTSDDNIGMDSDSETRSVQPLAKLLKDADGLLRSGQPSANKRRKLHPEVLDIQRMKDLGNPAPSAISSLSMHPTLPLLLSTAGSASTLYLHHLTTSTHHTQPNAPYPLLTSLHLLHTPITTTTFSPSPSDPRIFLAARRRFFHVWNLQSGIIEKITRITGHAHEQRSMGHLKPSPTGTHIALRGTGRKGAGTVTILDATTLQWVAAARVEARGGVADFAWWRDGQGLCIAAHDGEVTEWSLADRNTVARWRDEGAVNTTVLALGGSSQDTAPLGGDRWVAVGSSSGIVNVYDRRGWVEKGEVKIPECPRPTRALEHLTTPTSVLSFAPDGQVLAVASRWKKDALRLVHLPSCTVYRNWPTGATPLGRVTAVA